jgi:hypothetical protein
MHLVPVTKALQAFQELLQVVSRGGQQGQVVCIQQQAQFLTPKLNTHVPQPINHPLLQSIDKEAKQQRGEGIALFHTPPTIKGRAKSGAIFDRHWCMPIHASKSTEHVARHTQVSQALQQQIAVHQIVSLSEVHKAGV